MSIMSRMLGSFLLLTTLLLTCINISAHWLFEGDSPADWFDECVSLVEAQRRGEQLSRQAQLTAERLRIKDEIVEALRKGQMTLIDAAAYFRSLHEDPKSWRYPNDPWPGPKEGESWCRVVIEWTDRYLSCQQSPGQTNALRQRLEAELQEQLKAHGAVTLPET
jgi:hypothetical protein